MIAYYDPFELARKRIFKAIREAMREFEREFEELEEMAEEYMREVHELEKIFEDRIDEIRRGYTEPLSTIIDKEDELLLVIEAPEAREDTIEVTVTEDKIRVEGKIDKSKVEKALGKHIYTKKLEMVKGEYKLPYKLDPSKVKIEKRGNKIHIWIPKQPETY
ncbi:MAG: Hsp20 family protein [Acidilobaceae archaeon]